MSEFLIINEKRFPIELRVDKNGKIETDYLLSYWRFEHRVTVAYKGRRFSVLVDNGMRFGKTDYPARMYVEECTDGILKVIDNDELYTEVLKFVTEKGFCNVLPPLPKDKKHRII